MQTLLAEAVPVKPAYLKYADFDADFKFSEKCGFQLSSLQIQDVESFIQWSVSLNTYEVGGGKTVVSTVVSLMRGVSTTIVIMPPILLCSWYTWLAKISGKANVTLYQGTPKVRKGLSLDRRWIVMSYAIFRRDYDRISAELQAGNIEIIVDEAHWLKNPGSILFQKVQVLSAGHALQMLTGTPISKPEDAYAYIKLKTPKAYRSFGHFEAIHIVGRDYFDKPTEYAELDLMREHLEKQMISRTKKEIHGCNLEPLYPDTSYDLSDEHMKLYRKIVEEQLLVFDDGSKIDMTSAAKLRHALQQVVVNLDMFSNTPGARSAMYDLIDQTIEEIGCADKSRSKLIIWTKYKMTSRSLLNYCNSLGIQTVAAYSEADSAKSAELFMNDENTRILVAQYQSAGAGLNPQYVCSEALHAEFDTVPLYMRQACGRIDRMGQTTRPRMKLAVARNTVQEHLLACLTENDDLVSRIEPSKEGLRKLLLPNG